MVDNMSEEDDKIINLFSRNNEDEAMLNIDYSHLAKKCHHKYVINPEANTVYCPKCDKELNPVAVLVDLAKKESRYMQHAYTYKNEMMRLEKRSKTKCQHCGKMTRISKR